MGAKIIRRLFFFQRQGDWKEQENTADMHTYIIPEAAAEALLLAAKR